MAEVNGSARQWWRGPHAVAGRGRDGEAGISGPYRPVQWRVVSYRDTAVREREGKQHDGSLEATSQGTVCHSALDSPISIDLFGFVCVNKERSVIAV